MNQTRLAHGRASSPAVAIVTYVNASMIRRVCAAWAGVIPLMVLIA